MPTDRCLAHLVRRDWLTDGPLNELLALYIEALQNRRYARSTLSAYLRSLAHFSYWMRGEGLSVAGIDRALIERFKAEPKLEKVEEFAQIGPDRYFITARPQRFEEGCMHFHGDPADAPRELIQRWRRRG